MSKRDYYEILGVSKTASEAELKSAFRKLAMQCHPDRHPGDAAAEAKFKELNEAYQVLSDSQKRGAYDRYGHQAFEQGGGGGGNPDFSDFMSDIFDSFFGDARRGGPRGANGRERGADLRYNLEIGLEDAFAGKNASIRVPTSIACEVCSGTGAKPGSKSRQCPTCGGHGKVRANQGFFSVERTCPTCSGRGEIIDDPCKNCHGAGRVTRERTLSVNIPRASRTARASASPARARPACAADRRATSTSSCRSSRTRSSSATGGSVLPRPDRTGAGGARRRDRGADADRRAGAGEDPEGTQTGKQFRLKGKGMSVLRSREVGDLYIQVVVETPQKLTARQRELLQEFERESSGATHPEAAGFFGRVKDFLGGIGGTA